MRFRGCWFWLALLGTGCQSITPQDWDEKRFQAAQLWEHGQAALQTGQAENAIQLCLESLALDPQMVCNHLSLANAYLQKNNPEGACEHLGKYVKARPEHLSVRSRYAETLVRQEKYVEARDQLERLISDAQDQGAAGAEHMIRSHSRLMEVAESLHDLYGEHLNRGIGLYLLARKRYAFGDPEGGDLPVQGILCRAAAELTLAHHKRPEEARPCWYLFEVWSDLGQRFPATTQLKEAHAAAPFSYLTPFEQRSLYLAYEKQAVESQNR